MKCLKRVFTGERYMLTFLLLKWLWFQLIEFSFFYLKIIEYFFLNFTKDSNFVLSQVIYY